MNLVQTVFLVLLAGAFIYVALQVKAAILRTAAELKTALDDARGTVADLSDGLRSVRNRLDRIEERLEGNNKRPPYDLSAKVVGMR